MERPTRRDVLRATPVMLGALAGCEGLPDRGEPTPTPTAGEPGDTGNTGATATAPRRELELRNETGEDQYVSVAVSDDAGVVSSTTVELPLLTSRTFSIPAPTGILTVELETTTGVTGRHPWAVGDQMGDLVVTLTADGVTFSQSAWCDPDCEPLSRDGTAVELPYYGDVPGSTSYYGANVVIVNTTTRYREVSLRIDHDGDPILDYEYVVPPDLTLEFPGVHAAGDYTVTVQSEVGERSYDWHPPKERRLQLRLTEGDVHATCGTSTASFILGNADDVPHRLDIAAFRPGTDLAVLRRTYIVQPGARFRERAVYTGSGQYDLRVSTADGASTTYDWWLCPPRGPTEISIQANGKLHIVQYQPGE